MGEGEAERFGPGDAVRRVRRLIDVTAVVAFLLVVVGGVVRVSDAGLGCGPAGSGLRGWPLCNGRLVPIAHAHSVIEYTHRALAAMLVLLVLAILWEAFRRFRGERLFVAGAIAAALSSSCRRCSAPSRSSMASAPRSWPRIWERRCCCSAC